MGSDFNTSALRTLKTIVFAPMPRVSEMTATDVNPGLLRSTRKAYRVSCTTVSNHPQPHISRLLSLSVAVFQSPHGREPRLVRAGTAVAVCLGFHVEVRPNSDISTLKLLLASP